MNSWVGGIASTFMSGYIVICAYGVVVRLSIRQARRISGLEYHLTHLPDSRFHLILMRGNAQLKRVYQLMHLL